MVVCLSRPFFQPLTIFAKKLEHRSRNLNIFHDFFELFLLLTGEAHMKLFIYLRHCKVA